MFPRLFEPGHIGSMTIKNRIIMAPMGVDLFTKEGDITDRLIDYYAARARGGVGLITIEATYICFGGYYRGRIDDDKYIPHFKRLVDAIHENGAKVVLQIHNRKRQEGASGFHVGGIGASDYVDPLSGDKVRGLTIEEVENIVVEVGKAALRAKKAGFDGVNLHMAHGHLVCSFWTPITNRRTDNYGGSLENRARFGTELVESAKRYTGKDYPVTVKVSADSRVKGGFSITDAIPICQLLEKAGADALDVVSSFAETYEWLCAPMYAPHGYNVHLAEQIKKAVSIPVSVAGRIDNPAFAEEILQQGRTDFVDLGRALLADPEFPVKAMNGKVEDIRRCLACTECLKSVFDTKEIVCSVNAAVGKEREFQIKLSAKVKKVLVVGGGVGGMEAARIAALRGHSVTLWEKSDTLGGQLILAAAAPCKEEVNCLKEYLERQIRKCGVKIKLGMEATPASVMENGADVIVIATGSSPLIPEIPGIKQKKVVTARDVLTKKVAIGKKVVVIGGGMVGCEAADFLISKGNDVTIIEMLDEFAADTPFWVNRFLVRRLHDEGVKMLAKVKCEEILDEGVRIIDREGKSLILPAVSVVVAVGSTPNRELFKALEGKVPLLYEVGDCVKPRKILDSVREGAAIGYKI